MVHQNPLVLDNEKRQDLENGGGTKGQTKATREGIGQNFVLYCENREKLFAEQPKDAPGWWIPGLEVRTMEQVATVEHAVILGNYAKNWIKEMQVGFHDLR